MDSSPSSSQEYESEYAVELSDNGLSEKLQFIEEIGFGNWGSVWLCRTRTLGGTSSSGRTQKIAAKLVHRSGTPTARARVRSLWNEMKIIRTLQGGSHASIISFHTFVATPSFVLITMDYLPTLVPVEVDERKAREWFSSLLSGVEFLHVRGVVHNDIKPANILLSTKAVPVLVDFGFAEHYFPDSPNAFRSNLSYGTPEYLSPERARGLPHDTRKSDIWALGITFFEILMGRTPFEDSDVHGFRTQADLEKYWNRTKQGIWIGTWKISSGIERLIRRMITPDPNVRCSASQAMADSYWRPRAEPATPHRHSISSNSSIVFQKDMSKILSLSPWKARERKQEPRNPPVSLSTFSSEASFPQSRLLAKPVAKKANTRKRVAVDRLDFTPDRASLTTHSHAGKENATPRRTVPKTGTSTSARKPFGQVSPQIHQDSPALKRVPSAKHLSRGQMDMGNSFARPSEDSDISTPNRKKTPGKGKEPAQDHVRQRVKDWKREKERLRAIARLELEDSDDEEALGQIEGGVSEMVSTEVRGREVQSGTASRSSLVESFSVSTRLTSAQSLELEYMPPMMITPIAPDFSKRKSFSPEEYVSETPRPLTPSNGFRHNIRKSIDKTIHFYKSSSRPSHQDKHLTEIQPLEPYDNVRPRESWETEVIDHSDKGSKYKRSDSDENARLDRMSLWVQSVEKVVEDAKQGFESSTFIDPPALPIGPVSRSIPQNPAGRPRRPRRIPQASEIFADPGFSNDKTIESTPKNPVNMIALSTASRRHTLTIPEIRTPSKQRRATLQPTSSNSMTAGKQGSLSSRKGKSQSQDFVINRPIAPMELLEATLDEPEPPVTTPRLSAVIDPSVFIARPISSSTLIDDSSSTVAQNAREKSSFEDFTTRSWHRSSRTTNVSDASMQRKIENVYDRFLFATSGIKRNAGKAKQKKEVPCPENRKTLAPPVFLIGNHRSAIPVPSSTATSASASTSALTVPNENIQRRVASAGELRSKRAKASTQKVDNTITFVKRALQAFVPNKTLSKKSSQKGIIG